MGRAFWVVAGAGGALVSASAMLKGMEPVLHPDVASLAPLLGTWSGRGHGEYPTIEPFDYEESISFTHIGKPFLAYTQSTRHCADGRSLHAESGFWRVPEPGRIELVVAHPNGIVEIAEGTLEGTTMRLRSTVVGRSSSAKDVTVIERDWALDGGVLGYALRMTAVGQPLTHHLAAKLHRVD
jgi:hypothetical protein